MGFPSDIAEKALLDSGRHCCLCHRFCGTKIELHHIVQKADGGQDTYENCIPLCFDCHAEVKAYNPKHPKGRKFTGSELKGHRDRWYEKVKVNAGVVVNSNYLELDRKLFDEIRKILPSSGSVDFARFHDYGGAFPKESLNDFYSFYRYRTRPEFEFLDADLEGLRSKLINDIEEFLNLIGKFAFRNQVQPDWLEIDVQPELAIQVGKELNQLADKICQTYDDLIRLGRRKLGTS